MDYHFGVASRVGVMEIHASVWPIKLGPWHHASVWFLELG